MEPHSIQEFHVLDGVAPVVNRQAIVKKNDRLRLEQLSTGFSAQLEVH
jgi:hypothetical protein